MFYIHTCIESTPTIFTLQEIFLSSALVAHTYNPSYSGGRDQEDHGLKPTLSEKLFTKIGLVEWLKVKALSSSPSTTKKKEYF
jgi:hypothetical protein